MIHTMARMAKEGAGHGNASSGTICLCQHAIYGTETIQNTAHAGSAAILLAAGLGPWIAIITELKMPAPKSVTFFAPAFEKRSLHMEASLFTSITKAFTVGGIWMYAILAVHIVSIAIIAERVYFLYFRRSNDQKRLAGHFEGDIKKGNIEQAMSKAQALGRAQPIGVVAQAGFQSAMHMGGKEEIHAKMAEMIAVENAGLEKRISTLAMIGNVATLIGLLGTITGMIKSFSAVSMANAVEKATILSSGISEAMNCTAYGLIVAIPALVMYTVLMGRTHSLQDDLNQGATKILNWLSYNFETIPKKRKSL